MRAGPGAGIVPASCPRYQALRSAIRLAVLDRLRTPRPIRIGAATGSEASPPQTPVGRLCRAAPSVVAAISRSTAGCKASNCGRHTGIAAIHRQAILREIVGADRQKIGFRGQDIGGHRGGGRFDHDAERDGDRRDLNSARTPSRMVRTWRSSESEAIIGTMMRHCCRRNAAQDGAQLGRQKIRPPQADPHAAQTQGGVLFRGKRQIGRRLVSANVERANDQRPSLQGLGNRAIDFGLLRLAGRASADSETGTPCAATRSLRHRPPPRPLLLEASRDWRRFRSARRLGYDKVAAPSPAPPPALAGARRSAGWPRSSSPLEDRSTAGHGRHPAAILCRRE